ncbi:putative glutathione peroxidase 3 [Hyalella azteca]|uniref:Putative glutathione peroxidase 3 n=1 Tax=Hyalella azteca TaxID=294128 RepID=A0A6A0H8H9_HYAAZ|nr:putative glutathione peroxidase 3 [Hyalella azteca]
MPTEVPESNDEMMDALFYVRPGNGFVPTFPVFQKTLVNGDGEDAFFTFIKSGCSYTEEEFNVDLEYSPMTVSDFRQPFEKILVGKDGKPYFRYHASVDVSVVIADIDALLAA